MNQFDGGYRQDTINNINEINTKKYINIKNLKNKPKFVQDDIQKEILRLTFK